MVLISYLSSARFVCRKGFLALDPEFIWLVLLHLSANLGFDVGNLINLVCKVTDAGGNLSTCFL